MKNFLDKLKETGFFHIFSSQVLIKIVSLCSGLFIVGLLSVSDYGIYTNSTTALNTFLLLTGLGTSSAMLQFGSENYQNPEKKRAFLNFGFRVGFAFNLLMVIAIILYALLIIPLYDKSSQPFLLLLAFMPAVFYINDVVSINLRIDLRNKAYSLFNTMSTLLVFAATISGAILGGIFGIITLRYAAYILTILLILLLSRNTFAFLHHPAKLMRHEKAAFMKISVISAANNGIAALLNVIDTLLVGIILKNNVTTGAYGTASLIPTALLFIPQSIMIYVYPYFARHNRDIVWVKKQYHKLFKSMLILSFIITIGMCFCVPPIIKLFFGSKYDNCISIYQVLVVSFFFSAVLRMPSGNILVTLKKVKINFYLAIISGILNIVLDILFIKIWGAIGAAIATLCVNIFIGTCSTVYLRVFLNRKQSLDNVGA